MKELESVETPLEERQDAEPFESPETEFGRLLHQGGLRLPDPRAELEQMQAMAKEAPAMAEAMMTMLIAFTYAEDWSIHGKQSSDESKWKVCLSSAGAERVGVHFPYRMLRMQGPIREDWKDDNGEAYGFRYKVALEINAFGAIKQVLAEGVYHTRKPFKGKVNDEFRPLEDIDREDIRAAAYHIAIGNAFKTALGLRNLPYSQWKHLVERTGAQPGRASHVTYGEGTKGGTASSDQEKQQRVAKIVQDIVNVPGFVLHNREAGSYSIEAPSEMMGPDACIRSSLAALSEFKGKNNDWVSVTDARKLKGRWLNMTLANAEKVWKENEPDLIPSHDGN
ncbi:MAG: hypothetical protein Q8Q12_00565 [bacterium]|nr:hypothetical protein [bacterium]